MTEGPSKTDSEAETPTDHVADISDWESVGRNLLAEQLEWIREETLYNVLLNAEQRINRGEELTESDIEEMREALREAEHIVNLAARASPENAAEPNMWDFMDEESRQEYIEAAKQKREDGE